MGKDNLITVKYCPADKKGNKMEIGYGNNAKTCSPTLSGGIQMPSLEDRLKQRKFQLESSLKDINDALDAITANPDVLKILNLISKVNY